MVPKHIISASQFDKNTLQQIFSLTEKIKSGKFKRNILSDKIMATLFYEPSTRTRFSFESAMHRLGGSVISTENAKEFSSAIKGETLEDTVRIVNGYSDVIVIRHFKKGTAQIASEHSRVPVINAGDGEGEHPTQALLDIFTIFSKIHHDDFTVAMIGDLKYGRTVHSLSYLLSLYPKVKIIFVSPKILTIPKNLATHLKKHNMNFIETEDFKTALTNADVIYQTRIQKERFKNEKEYKKYFGKFILDKNTLKIIKKKAIIMHPLPRINEITKDVDYDKRAVYFEQAQNGVFTRMALLMTLFDIF